MQGKSVFGSRKLAKRRCREALVATRGNLAAAAELLKCSRQNVHQMVSRDEDLKALCDELMEINKDTWEQSLHDIGTKHSNPTALLGLLNAHARDRGYARHATDINISGNVDHYHLHVHSEKFKQLSNDDLMREIAQRRAELAAEPPMITVNPKRD